MKPREQRGQARPYHGAVISATRLVRAGIALTIMGMGSVSGCSDPPGPVCCEPLQDLIVSDAVPAARIASGARTAVAPVSSAGDEVAYVSLPPGTQPTGRTARIRLVGSAGSQVTTVIDGGFDPVPVNAGAGDSIDVSVRNAGGQTVLQTRLAVAARRPPIIVRTRPPRRKTDVPLNSPIVIVFSEPIDGNSLTASSVQLFRGTSAVPGTIQILQGTGAAAAFVPSAPLAANTEYRLEVARAVQDRDGDALTAAVSLSFTTGQSSLGPPASIELSPSDTVFMTGPTYQVTATVRDGSGNVLIDQQLEWISNNPTGLSVSPTGLLTASAVGQYYVTATLNGLTAAVNVKVPPGPPVAIEISSASAAVPVLDTLPLTASLRDAAGVPVPCPAPMSWTSSNRAVATVTFSYCGYAELIGVSPGNVMITATSGTLSDTALITVNPPLPVASVTVAPAASMLVVAVTRQLSATLQDASGRTIGGRPITWTSNNAAVAGVNANGLVTGVSLGSAAVTATSGGHSDTASITVTAPLSLESVSAGVESTCGLTPNGAAYCWGANEVGELGTSGATGPETCFFSPSYPGVPCSTVPVPVAGGLTFTSLTMSGATNDAHACGITTSGAAYCWGGNQIGQLGIGTTIGPETCGGHACRTVPALVAGGLTFAQLAAGYAHTCGLTSAGAAYCWGANGGQFGDGSTSSSVPVPVRGGLTFSTLSTTDGVACGVMSTGAAYCWGRNEQGRLGNGTRISGSLPVAVSGGLTFSAVTSGTQMCGLTVSGAAYCWGPGIERHLSNGTTETCTNSFDVCSTVPVPVNGGLRFSALSAGNQTCGITTSGAAYCWGASLVPVPVSGGLAFSAVSPGFTHTCGVTTSGAGYCWGTNATGQLGDGSTIYSAVPVRVAGQP